MTIVFLGLPLIFFFRIWPIATGLAFFVSLHAFRPYEIAFPMPTGKKLWNSCRETQLDSTEWKKTTSGNWNILLFYFKVVVNMFNQTNSYWSVIGCIAIFLFTWETSSTGMIPNGSCLLIGLPSGNQTWFILVWTGWTVSISRPIPSGPPCLMTHAMPRRQGAALRLQDIISLPLRNRPLIPTLWILDTNKKPSFSEETTWMWTQDFFLFDKYMNIYIYGVMMLLCFLKLIGGLSQVSRMCGWFERSLRPHRQKMFRQQYTLSFDIACIYLFWAFCSTKNHLANLPFIILHLILWIEWNWNCYWDWFTIHSFTIHS